MSLEGSLFGAWGGGGVLLQHSGFCDPTECLKDVCEPRAVLNPRL